MGAPAEHALSLLQGFRPRGRCLGPLIAHWPQGIKRAGALCRDQTHIIDLMATCVEVAGARYPATFHGKKILPLEGKSLVPSFSGGRVGHEALFWEHNGKCAILEGDWKLVRLVGAPWELYDLKRDRTELNNLARQAPERVRALEAKWNVWAERTGVFPKPHKEQMRPAGK